MITTRSRSAQLAATTIALLACSVAAFADGPVRKLLAPTDPGSPMAGVEYFTGQISEGAHYVQQGLKLLDEHYDFPTDGVVNGKVLTGRADNMVKAADALLSQAKKVYKEPAFPFPNKTKKFWTGNRIPEDKGTWVGLMAAGRGLAMLSNSTESMVAFPELIAEAINAGLADEIMTVATTTREIIAHIVAAFSGSLDAAHERNSSLLLDAVEATKSASGAATTAGRKLLQDEDEDAEKEEEEKKCDIKWLTVNQYMIDQTDDCEYEDALLAFEEMDKAAKRAVEGMEEGSEDVWRTVTGTQGGAKCSEYNYKGAATGELLEHIRDDEIMRPCTGLGCYECTYAHTDGKVKLANCSQSNDDRQQWVYEDADEPGVDMFRIKNDKTKTCIAAGGEKGERVHMAKCDKPAGEAQTWQVKEVESLGLFRSPFYSVMHAASGLCLTLERDDKEDSLLFILDECNCQPSQVFKGDKY